MRLPPLLLLLLPALAQAQPTASDPARERAMALYEQGRAASQNNNWKDAHKHFFEAWNLKHHVQIAANLGLAEFKLSMFRDAAEHLDFVLKNAPPGMSSNDLKLTQDMFDQSRQHIGEIAVSVNLDGANIWINGRPEGRSPLSKIFFVDPGTHIIEARMDGYQGAKRSINLEAGAPRATVQLTLTAPSTDKTSAKPSMNLPVLYSGLGLTGAAFVVTGVFAGLAISNRQEHSRLYDNFLYCAIAMDETACRTELYDVAEKWALNANVALGAGIAAGILGASVFSYWYAMRTPSGQKNTTAVGINAGPGRIDANVVVLW